MVSLSGYWVTDAIILLFTGLILYLSHVYTFWWRHGVPFLWPTPPFGNIASTITLRLSSTEMFARLYANSVGHKLVGVYQMLQPTLMIRDPEIIKHLFVKDFSHFTDRSVYFDEKLEPLSAHLFNLRGDRWKTLRTKLIPTFTPLNMKMMFHAVRDCGVELQHLITDLASREVEFEIRDLVARFATDVIATCAFGIQCNSIKNPNAEFREWGRRAFEPSFSGALRLAVMFMFPSLGPILKVPNFSSSVTKFFRDAVTETVEYRQKNGVSRNDFLQLLIQLKNSGTTGGSLAVVQGNTQGGGPGTSEVIGSSASLTMDEIAAQAFVFYLAGFETESTVISFCLFELTICQDIQDRVCEEVDATLKRHGGELTYQALQEMEYLDRVLLETMRKHPAVAFLSRRCTKTYAVPDTDVIIDEGQGIIIPIAGLHNDPEYYPDPERFDPERFTEANRKTRHQYAYLPFGEGPRACIGMRFAMMEAKIAVASVVTKFRLSLSKKTKLPIKLDPKNFFPTIQGGVWMQATAR